MYLPGAPSTGSLLAERMRSADEPVSGRRLMSELDARHDGPQRCWDTAAAESFSSTFKTEFYDRHHWESQGRSQDRLRGAGSRNATTAAGTPRSACSPQYASKHTDLRRHTPPDRVSTVRGQPQFGQEGFQFFRHTSSVGALRLLPPERHAPRDQPSSEASPRTARHRFQVSRAILP